ncbi:MAG: TA system VapC family ribonuclease toxin [Candidatus Dormiibacterota bacterium]
MPLTHLLDCNVLIALAVDDHVHHLAAARWLESSSDPVATCPITQGALVRLLLREGMSGEQSAQTLLGINNHPRHSFWPDTIGYDSVELTLIFGHSQVTDAYLVALTRNHHARLATFDRDLAKRAPEVATLISLG